LTDFQELYGNQFTYEGKCAIRFAASIIAKAIQSSIEPVEFCASSLSRMHVALAGEAAGNV